MTTESELKLEDETKKPRDGKLKCVGYIRTDPGDVGPSMATQRAALERWAENLGANLLAVYVDNELEPDCPFDRRTGLAQAINALPRLHAMALVVHEQTRLSDDPLAGLFIQLLAHRRNNANIYQANGAQSLNWGKDLGDIEILLARFIDASDALDFALQNEETSVDMEAAIAAKNLWNKTDKKTGRRLFTLREISSELEKRNLLSRLGVPYSPGMVQKMIDSQSEQEAERKKIGDAERRVRSVDRVLVPAG